MSKSRILSSRTREGRGFVILCLSLLILTSASACTAAIPSTLLPESTPEANLQMHEIPVAIFIQDGAFTYSVNGVVIPNNQLDLKISEAIAGHDNASILLYADERVPTAYIVEVMDLAFQKGIKVNVVTDESE
ncbi:MAG: biopolymer transporter ExbD [Flavobacteriia bacterium]|nr:biopolymer transporter ExbD [Flavobacteriia bacterium]